MFPEKFKGEYQTLLKEYTEKVLDPVNELKQILIVDFKADHNLSDNQIDLLDREPPF